MSRPLTRPTATHTTTTTAKRHGPCSRPTLISEPSSGAKKGTSRNRLAAEPSAETEDASVPTMSTRAQRKHLNPNIRAARVSGGEPHVLLLPGPFGQCPDHLRQDRRPRGAGQAEHQHAVGCLEGPDLRLRRCRATRRRCHRRGHCSRSNSLSRDGRASWPTKRRAKEGMAGSKTQGRQCTGLGADRAPGHVWHLRHQTEARMDALPASKAHRFTRKVRRPRFDVSLPDKLSIRATELHGAASEAPPRASSAGFRRVPRARLAPGLKTAVWMSSRTPNLTSEVLPQTCLGHVARVHGTLKKAVAVPETSGAEGRLPDLGRAASVVRPGDPGMPSAPKDPQFCSQTRSEPIRQSW
jgi:hypothetical protein